METSASEPMSSSSRPDPRPRLIDHNWSSAVATSPPSDAGGSRRPRRPLLLTGLRLIPAACLLAGMLAVAPASGATGCHVAPGNIRVNGGVSRNTTTVNPSANGGTSISNAQGGDDNIAFGLLGNANAGNGGTANSRANGGAISIGDINSGGNLGNVIRVRGAKSKTCYGRSGSRIVVNGGLSSNSTTVTPSANGGTAISNAQGGDDNLAVGILGNANAGNGGTANSSANGGAISLGNINSGSNVGNVIDVSNTGYSGGYSGGSIQASGGISTNTTTINPSANGGTAISDASGGDDNLALGLGGNANAGNGGTADSSANGGSISIGDVNSGNNTGNILDIGN